MTVRVLTGSKQQIAQPVSQLPGEVREAIVFIDETPAASSPPAGPHSPRATASVGEMFAEMRPYMADVGGAPVDDSREAIYERQEGERSSSTRTC
jgi:hypothetical protein